MNRYSFSRVNMEEWKNEVVDLGRERLQKWDQDHGHDARCPGHVDDAWKL